MTTLYLTTGGGHLAELMALEGLLPTDGDELWLTHRTLQTESALAGRDVIYVPYVRVKNVPDVLRCVPHARRLLRERDIKIAVSTGSSIALGYLPYLASRGVECHYIESAARVYGPSLTGRVLRRVPGVQTYTQHERWADGAWPCLGSVFDRFASGPPIEVPQRPLRVVVTIGSAPEFPFRRLLTHLAYLLSPAGPVARSTGGPPEVLWQTGATPVDDLPITATAFLTDDALNRELAAADVVVSHAGVGSALAAMRHGRLPILLPRLAAFGEVGDDHQVELAADLVDRGVAMWRDPHTLSVEDLLDAATRSVVRTAEPERSVAVARPRTTLFVATTGGHLAQLDQLSSRVDLGDGPGSKGSLWVTHENEQSRSLMEHRDAEFVRYVRVRNIPDVLRCIPHARRLVKERSITHAVSTGSGIALGYLPYLAARGVECHYIESAARVSGPSLTGRLMRRVPKVRTYTQYPHWAGDGWIYGGSVFDGFEPVTVEPDVPDPIRVAVTVGTAAEFPFARLIHHLVPLLAPGGRLAEATGSRVEVLWQTGCTPVDQLSIEATPFMAAADLDRALREADIVISHAGTGSALAALEAGRFPVLASREVEYGEAGDDHQAQLARELARRGLGLDRRPTAITVDDLLMTLGSRIQRSAAPPKFELAP